MKCPIDKTELNEIEYERTIKVDQCESCNGMWLHDWELKAIQANKGNNYEEEIKLLADVVNQSYLQAIDKTRPLIDCPKCADDNNTVQMERREHGYCSQIMIDVCPECNGIWLDKGEINALEIFFERSHIDDEEIKVGFFQNLWFMLNK
jgi:Zn-finger nucleic acid-binding protein